jgi:restriction endonuclease S subunit
LGDVCSSISDGDHQPPPKADTGVPFITISNLDEASGINFKKTFFVPQSYFDSLKDHRKPKNGDILYSVTGSYGIAICVEGNQNFCFQRHIALLRPSERVLPRYLLNILISPFGKQQGDEAATGVAQKTVSLSSLRTFRIPLPSLEEQCVIVAQIEHEQRLIAANKELITLFEAKIKTTINRVWGENGEDKEG